VKGATLVAVKETGMSGDGREPRGNNSLKNLRDGLEEDDNAKGEGGIIGGFAGFVEDNAVGFFHGGGVVAI